MDWKTWGGRLEVGVRRIDHDVMTGATSIGDEGIAGEGKGRRYGRRGGDCFVNVNRSYTVIGRIDVRWGSRPSVLDVRSARIGPHFGGASLGIGFCCGVDMSFALSVAGGTGV